MPDIETKIQEYCARHLPPDPIWVVILNQKFPQIAARVDSGRPVRLEMEHHLRDSYEAHLTKVQNPEEAWKLAREQFGDVSVISRAIEMARTQSHKCLMIRFASILALLTLPLGEMARIRIPAFFHPELLCFLTACAALGFLITRRHNMDSLRRYAFYGAWIGLFWGIFRSIAAQPTELGSAVALILLSTFYGLFVAAPRSKAAVSLIMMAICHLGILASLTKIGIPIIGSGAAAIASLKIAFAFSMVSVLVGLAIFDIRKLHHHIAGVAAFGMAFAYIQILSNMTRSTASLSGLAMVASIPPLMAVLAGIPIRKLKSRLLREAN